MSVVETITTAAKKTAEFCAENKVACAITAGVVVAGAGVAIHHVRRRRMEKKVENLVELLSDSLAEELEAVKAVK